MSWEHTKFDFAVDEENGRLNLSRDKKLRQAPQKEGVLYTLVRGKGRRGVLKSLYKERIICGAT